MLLAIKSAVELLPVGKIVIDGESPSGLRGRRGGRSEEVFNESGSRSIGSGYKGKKALRVLAETLCRDLVLRPLLTRYGSRPVVQTPRRSHEAARDENGGLSKDAVTIGSAESAEVSRD